MAAFDETQVITDPDELGYQADVTFGSATEEILINTTSKTIALKVTGNLTLNGATIKAVYSKLKDAWRGDNVTKTATGTSGAGTITVSPDETGLIVGQTVSGTGIALGAKITNIAGTTITLSINNSGTVSGTVTFSFGLIKYPFPMGPITDEQFEMINGWNWDLSNTSGGASQTTDQLLRTGGWSVVDTSNNINELWSSVITLGDLGSTDQAYYQQLNSDRTSVNFVLTGKVNQAIRIYYYDGSGTRPSAEALSDTMTADGYVLRRYFKIFVREWQKIYAQSEIGDIGVSQLTYQAYRFPLTNSTDLKVTHTEQFVSSGAAISTIVGSSGTVTVDTATAHGLSANDYVVITGTSAFNGTYQVATVPSTTQITYTDATTGSGSTGFARRAVYANINITYLRYAVTPTISTASWSTGVVTVTTTAAHGLSTGQVINIVGVTPSGYNGTYTITVTGASTFTYALGTTPGSYTSGGSLYIPYVIQGAWVDATVYKLGDVVQGSDGLWYKCILAHTAGASSEPITGGTYATYWSDYEGDRQIGNSNYAFTIVIDADTTVAPEASGAARTTEIYELIQYNLRLSSDIDAGAVSVTGKTADSLLRFVGDTLVTSDGVYIDSFNASDTNSIEFSDYSGTSRTFPYVASLIVNFGTNLQNDEYSKYWVFFTTGSFTKTATGTSGQNTITVSPDESGITIGQSVTGTGIGASAVVTGVSGTTVTLSVNNSGSVSGTITFTSTYGTQAAIIVQDKDGVQMTDDVNPSWPTKRSSVTHTYNYDSNDQRGGGTYNSGDGIGDTAKTDAPITVIGIGLATGQYVSATGTIQRSTSNSVTLTASLERNYSAGTVTP